MGSHGAFPVELFPASVPNLHLHLVTGLFGEQPEQSSVNMNNRSHGGWGRMENTAYKVGGMVLTIQIGAAFEEERNGILNFYIIYTKVKMFLQNPLLSTNFIPAHPLKINSRLASFHEISLLPRVCVVSFNSIILPLHCAALFSSHYMNYFFAHSI